MVADTLIEPRRSSNLNFLGKALGFSQDCEDHIVPARCHEGMALIYENLYDYEKYVSSLVKASGIYHSAGLHEYEIDCMLWALNGTLITKDQATADSLIAAIESHEGLGRNARQRLIDNKMIGAIQFSSPDELNLMIDSIRNISDCSNDVLLGLAHALHKADRPHEAMDILQKITRSGEPYDTLRYESIYVWIAKDAGQYKDALEMYFQLNQFLDSIHARRFNLQMRRMQDRYDTEIKSLTESKRKSRIILLSIIAAVAVFSGISILLLIIRNQRISKEVTLQQAETARAQSALLTIENKMVALERDKKAVEINHLSQRISILEEELESLKAIDFTESEIPTEACAAIQNRIEFLNSLIGAHISEKEMAAETYESCMNEITENAGEFMDSTRLAYKASHPAFIQYLEKHGLTVDEINYCCLYTIGLNGKDVGKYLGRPGHINKSSAIRKKLNLDRHETNLSIYLRRLLKSMKQI